ncbi:class I SAM-dependent methyltransferase [Sphingomonas sp. Leaf25]|uniref:class I SAM-dependent methyltransferase n=1 Tax=Sphingomonas sp. Leaf25 TaxID=1735692 RepID=UPI0009ECC05A
MRGWRGDHAVSGVVGPHGQVIGVDIAPRVIALAERRAMDTSNVTFLQDDAGIMSLPGHSLDIIFSRFVTMFFSDPVAAFHNMRRMLKPGGKIGFVCWRSVDEISWTHFASMSPDCLSRSIRRRTALNKRLPLSRCLRRLASGMSSSRRSMYG